MAQASLDDVDLVLKTMANDDRRQRGLLRPARLDRRRRRLRLLAPQRLRGRRQRLRHVRSVERRRRCSRRSALVISGKVGGVSGPIWGTAFLRAGVSGRRQDRARPRGRHRDAPRVDRRDHAARRLVARRQDAARCARPGHRQPRGELRRSGDRERPRRRRDPEGRRRGGRRPPRTPRPMLAMRGRAAYTGERSIGSVDAGATAIGVILQAISAAWRDKYGRQEDTGVKKFVNDPKQFVPEFLEGVALASRRHAQVRAEVQPDLPGRHAQEGPGLDHPGLRLRPRAGAHDDRRPRHARRRLPRRRLRRPAGRVRHRDVQADGHAGRRALHRQQLHRRPHRLGDGQGAPGGRGPEDRLPARQRRRGRQGLDLDGRPARCRRQLLRDQGRRREGRQGRLARGVRPRSARRSSPTSGRWASRSRRARRRSAARRCSRSATTRWRSASASTASRAASAARPARQRDRRHPARRDRPRPAVQDAATRSRSWSTAWAARRSASSTCCTASPTRSSPHKGIKVFRSYVGEYCTSLEMAGAHISLLKVDDELKELLLAPAEIAYRVF